MVNTKIVYHAFKINSYSTVVVMCFYTGIVVIILGNFHKLTAKIYIEYGVSRSRPIIDMKALHELLELNLCKAFAFSDCDYDPAFFRKGKQHPIKMQKARSFSSVRLFRSYDDRYK